jgi:hypothetical protein
VIAHDFDDLGGLRKCVAREWALFKPRKLRFISEPDVPLPAKARADMTIHATRYSNMNGADGRVTLSPFSAPEEASAIVEQKFSDLRQTSPDLARVLTVPTPENLSLWHNAGHLRAIDADLNGARETVGLFAAACVSGVSNTRRPPGRAAVRVPRIGSVGAGSTGELSMSLSSRSQP